MEQASYDILVLGSGGAGLRAAVSAREAGLSVCVVSRGNPGKYTCTGYSAGVMAGSADSEGCRQHLERTLRAGRGINDPVLASILAAEAPRRLAELMDWGIRADFMNGWLFALGRPPFKGNAITGCLLKKGRMLGVHYKGHIRITDLVAEDGQLGVLGLDQTTGRWILLTASAVILATGGAAALYERHDNPAHMIGDGYRLAFEAGAVLQDMEFVQFYPLCLAEPGYLPLVIPPRLADQGRLINDKGEEIQEKYGIRERPAAEKARDGLSQAILREIRDENQGVRLDLTGVAEDEWNIDPFSAGVKELLGMRCGAFKRPVRVLPAAHHVMGGVRTDEWGRTGVPGLLAAGEVTGGLHGANRSGGNALSDILVFGARAGTAAADHVRCAVRKSPRSLIERMEALCRQRAAEPVEGSALLSRIRRILWEHGGIIRNENGLSGALNTMREFLAESSPTIRTADDGHFILSLECRSALKVACWILESARRRCESRGAHFREDFPECDDLRWLGHQQISRGPNGSTIWKLDKITAPIGKAGR